MILKELLSLDIKLVDLKKILIAVRQYSMVSDDGIYFTMLRTIRAIRDNKEGVIVECGTWKGGCSLAMLLVQKILYGEVVKPVYMFDSFEGLPPAEDIDGPLAKAWQLNVGSPNYYNNCSAELSEVRDMITSFGFTENEDFYLCKGWFNETLPKYKDLFRETNIALLRLDGDWYDSTIESLNNLFEYVSSGGTVILDDYFAWDGCAQAVHEFLGQNRLAYRIRSIDHFQAAYVEKSIRTDLNRL